jgi:uncharacterized protein with HEPN domain
MLPNEKNDLMYLINILEYIGKIYKYTEGINNADELYDKNEQLNLNASLTLLANYRREYFKNIRKVKK